MEVKSPDEVFSTLDQRADVQKVYDQIIEDANDAAQVLPESYSSQKEGRATEGAAKTLLADI